jgi:DNA-directed RNA polymerase sigma subunit (sigma70/sigma32)
MKNKDVVSLTETKDNKRLFHGFNKLVGEAYSSLGVCHPSKEVLLFVSQKLGVDYEKVEKYAHFKNKTVYLDQETDESTSLIDNLTDGVMLEETLDIDPEIDVNYMLSCLDERGRYIIENRYLSEDKMPFKDIAEKYGVSIEAIRQSEVKALNKLKQLIEGDI